MDQIKSIGDLREQAEGRKEAAELERHREIMAERAAQLIPELIRGAMELDDPFEGGQILEALERTARALLLAVGKCKGDVPRHRE